MVTDSPHRRSRMWEYQSHFRASANAAAHEVFNSLDPHLQPTIVLAGIDLQTGEIEFDGLREGKDVRSLELPVDPSTLDRIKHSDSDPSRNVVSTLATQKGDAGIRKIVASRLDLLPESRDLLWYFSAPARIGDHMVLLALSLDRSVVAGYCGSDEVVSREIDQSLLNAVIFEYLNLCHSVLIERDPGSRLTLYGGGQADLLRSAANQLMYKLTYRTRQWGYPVSLFDACNVISSLRYEGEPGIGTMVIAERESVEVDVVVELLSRVSLTDHRGTRKLLEMATEQMCLLSDAGYIYGLGRCHEEDTTSPNGLVRVDFTGHYAWEVSFNRRPLMRVINGHPQLPGKPVNEGDFRSSIASYFCGIAPVEVDRLWEIVLEASRQSHGTLIVISTGARFEAERLGSQCIRTKPMIPSRDVVRTITAIDGAVLLSPDGTCHAIGVILDGLSSSRGNPMRGSRFNSAVRYVETSRKQFGYVAWAVVVSEDGMVDLITPGGELGNESLDESDGRREEADLPESTDRNQRE